MAPEMRFFCVFRFSCNHKYIQNTIYNIVFSLDFHLTQNQSNNFQELIRKKNNRKNWSLLNYHIVTKLDGNNNK